MKNPPRDCQDPIIPGKDEEIICAGLAPARIILFRHAEKTGIADDRGLSALGKQRAMSLAIALPDHFGPIGTIIAARSTGESARPVQTVEPLASVLGLPIDERWGTNDYAELAHELAGRHHGGSLVLICWRHKTLQQLARSLGVHNAPPWSETLYERIWVLTTLDGRIAFAEFRAPMKNGRIQIVPGNAD